MSRWIKHARSPQDLGRQAIALLLSLKGSVCLYQGEELGLPEADLLFEELTDPPGIRFWPDYKGRDGCRTPIPWEEGEAPNGFTTGKPWLPVKPPHSVLNVAAQNADPASLLQFYRRILAWRREHEMLIDGDIAFFEVDEPVLAFRRSGHSGNMVCLFNLSPEPLSVALVGGPTGIAAGEISQAAELAGDTLRLGPNGYAFLPEALDAAPLSISFKASEKLAETA